MKIKEREVPLCRGERGWKGWLSGSARYPAEWREQGAGTGK